MTGTMLNVLGILIGGILGLFWIKAMTPRHQAMLKVWLGIFAVIVGLMPGGLGWWRCGEWLWEVAGRCRGHQ